MARQHLELGRDLGRREFATRFARVAYVLAHVGNETAAANVLSSSEALIDEVGAAQAWVERLNEKTRAAAHEQLGEAAFSTAYAEGRTLTVDETFELALAALG